MTTLIGDANLSKRRLPRRGRWGKARLEQAIKGARAVLVQAFAAQAGRWGLWVPIALMIGAALYMSAPAEPPSWLAPVLTILFAIVAATLALPAGPFARLRLIVAAFVVLAFAAALGASAAWLRTTLAAQPRLEQASDPARITGWVLSTEPGATRPRMEILVRDIDGEASPVRRIRLSVLNPFPPGRAISCLALLRPLEGPLAPRGYDFARRAYFLGLGGTGFALGRCRPVAAAEPEDFGQRLMLKLAALRRDLTESIAAASPGEGGAIAAALVTGDRSLMNEDTALAFRDSGLGHLLSVSGLHMGLAAGAVFAVVHWALALIPPLALRAPIRKIAALAALGTGAVYLVISGASVPAQRAYVMTAVALGAVLLDRPAFTLRALAAAGVLVVLLQPESVVEPGFQMSFAATAALVAAFEVRRRDGLPTFAPGWLLGGLDRVWKSLSAMLAASLVAGLATDPFALFHFQRLSVYGLPANLAATPIISFVVAPAAVAAAALAPFGLAEPALALMGAALDLVRAIGAVFAARPEAVRSMPLMSEAAFQLSIAALLCACLLRHVLRWIALPLLAVAVWLYAAEPKATLWADGELRAVLGRTESGWRIARDDRRGGFAAGRLAGLAGLSPQEFGGVGRAPRLRAGALQLAEPLWSNDPCGSRKHRLRRGVREGRAHPGAPGGARRLPVSLRAGFAG